MPLFQMICPKQSLSSSSSSHSHSILTNFKAPITLLTNIKLRRWSAVTKHLLLIGSCFTKSMAMLATMDKPNENPNEENDCSNNYYKNYVDVHCAKLLRWCCRHGAPIEVVDVVLSMSSECASIMDSNTGRLALHEAVRGNSSADVIRMLHKYNPNAIMTRDYTHSLTPLLLAVRQKHIREETLKSLIRLRPKMLVLKDNNGFTPLEHVLFSKNVSVSTTTLRLLQQYTASYGKRVNGQMRKRRSRSLSLERQMRLDGGMTIMTESSHKSDNFVEQNDHTITDSFNTIITAF